MKHPLSLPWTRRCSTREVRRSARRATYLLFHSLPVPAGASWGLWLAQSLSADIGQMLTKPPAFFTDLLSHGPRPSPTLACESASGGRAAPSLCLLFPPHPLQPFVLSVGFFSLSFSNTCLGLQLSVLPHWRGVGGEGGAGVWRQQLHPKPHSRCRTRNGIREVKFLLLG